jgi:hypothetical protein
MQSQLEQILTRVADQTAGEINRNVFHSAKSVEARWRQGALIQCLGFIFGLQEIVLYHRQLNAKEDWRRRRLWFLPFMSSKQGQDASFTELGKWHTDTLSIADVQSSIDHWLTAYGIKQKE